MSVRLAKEPWNSLSLAEKADDMKNTPLEQRCGKKWEGLCRNTERCLSNFRFDYEDTKLGNQDVIYLRRAALKRKRNVVKKMKIVRGKVILYGFGDHSLAFVL